jgi:spore maturation protein CgeB
LNYKFVKITSYYRKFLEYYYSRKPDIIYESYVDQYNDLMNQGFGWSDFYKKNMELIGNESYEIVFNVSNIQQRWAEENFIKASGTDILYHQLKKIKPEVVFFQDSVSFSPEYIKKIRADIPSIKLIIGWLCSPSSALHLDTFKVFDFVCVCSPEFTQYLNRKGILTYELNHAFEDSVLKRLETTERKEDLIFIGSFIGSRDFHQDRIQLIESLLDTDIQIKIHTDLNELPWIKLKSVQAVYIYTDILKKLGLSRFAHSFPLIKKTASLSEFPRNINFSEKFRKSVNPPLYGYEMFREINKSKAGLNIHGGVAGDFAANSRMFEITGVGGLLITDNKKNIKDFFLPDEEILVYDTPEECSEKIKWAIDNTEELERIATAGQKRTLKDHTFRRRTDQLNELIQKHLS